MFSHGSWKTNTSFVSKDSIGKSNTYNRKYKTDSFTPWLHMFMLQTGKPQIIFNLLS